MHSIEQPGSRVIPQTRGRPTSNRSHDDLPDDLVFRENDLGGDMPTFALNFSLPGSSHA